MAYRNKEDQKAASRRHYIKNKKAYLLRNQGYRALIANYVRKIKSTTPCTDCKITYPYYVMDFDHLGDKDYEIHYLANTGRIGLLKKEIVKCEVVCANCHRKRTHQRAINKHP